ncbi:alpha-glucuronidase family glycosyl hydrolase [Mucilaginibacter arboris]|uniref:Xylan alpha-1,2-glucuronidase n=1 Tax=Mucilaginibacter arboris TaxID=2682090 RepID=A0A7K1T036_9SPHI|nr:alpha-glucuronidase family glycosyl hydrolase [Mucilaginibacter arboris]MVN22660.1 alpha-glucuronidase [Mucilaginibacter arboris]
MKKLFLYFFFLLFSSVQVNAENGYRLWLRYDKVDNKALYTQYRASITQLVFPAKTATLTEAKNEITTGIKGLLQLDLPQKETVTANGALLICTPSSSKLINFSPVKEALKEVGQEGYIIRSLTVNGKLATVIAANTDIGALYGVFNFLKLLQTQQSIKNLAISDFPRTKIRLLNHWDNLDGSVERGYAGKSLWNWAALPTTIDPRYRDYARANASIGINGAVLTNVNANALILTKEYLVKVAALANTFRPYGVKVYLTARFSAPIEIGGLKTADPLDPTVRKWWKDKTDEIYQYIPDFGGFLVKANSEGQPGPQNYGRNHVDGANMFAEALASHKGIVMWRAFVYDEKVPDDRTKQAYTEFKPLDGLFKPNVIVQIKNGPLDFQPREPFSPLFGAMPKTTEMMEFQVTKEYLGFASNLVFLAPLYKECLDADTYSKGKGSTVAKIVEGKLDNHALSGMAGVANIGNNINWCGNTFAQSNWYAYGKLAWNPDLTSAAIADEWLRMTFNNDESFIDPIKKIMLNSREVAVNYMTPLGLHHQMSRNIHYGPGPWVTGGRADQTSIYYNKADSVGIGFDRTAATGSKAVEQYFPPLRNEFENIKTTPEIYLLWFHHVPWNYRMKSGETLWNELVDHYYSGVASVKEMQHTWDQIGPKIDAERFKEEQHALAVQHEDAVWWKDACLLYYQTFSHLPIPDKYEKPAHDLAYYKTLHLNPFR